MRNFARFFHIAAAALAISCAAPQAFADFGITNDGLVGSGSGHGNSDWGGWTFSTSQAISVSALGMWGTATGTLLNSHPLGIFDLTTSTQLVGTTISGSGDFAGPDGYLYKNLATPFVLGAGTYFVGAFYNSGSPDNFLVNGDVGTFVDPLHPAETFGSGISFMDNRVYFAGNSSSLGSQVFVGKSFLGGNFEFASAVPEPEISAMLTIGLGFLGWQARRRSGMRNRAA